MDLLEKTLKNSYDYAIHRMDVLCRLGTVEDVEDAESIRQEFKEWITCLGEHPELLEESVLSLQRTQGKHHHVERDGATDGAVEI